MIDFMQAWKINEKDFPQNGSMAEKLAFCVRYAILAPSPYNTQPWFFKVSGSTVNVYIDRRYGLPVIDPDDRAMIIFCAGALFTLRVALHHFGLSEKVEILPDESDSDLLARVHVSAGDIKRTEEDEVLFRAVPKRHTNRGAFTDKEVPEDVLRSLKAAATSEGAWLHICSVHERQTVVNMIAEADHIQTGNKNFRRELAAWVDQRRYLSGDGMPEIGLTYKDVMTNLSPTVARRFESENHQAVDNAHLAEGSPVIAVLGTMSGGMVERIHAGQALVKVLLEAENNGVAISMLNQPCEVPELRLRLHDEIAHQGRSHMILRMGYGGKPLYTQRRTLSSLIEVDGKPYTDKKTKVAVNDGGEGGLFGKVRKIFHK